MKNFWLLLFFTTALLMSRCGINKQLEQAKVLEKCHFELLGTDSVSLAGTQLNGLKDAAAISLATLPALTSGVLSKNVPLSARLELRITNGTNQTAAINQFEYKILLEGKEMFNGFVNHKTVVSAGGGQTVVPVRVFGNVYPFFADAQMRSALIGLISGLAGASNQAGPMITFKIRPTIDIAGHLIKYPGYISFDKQLGATKN